MNTVKFAVAGCGFIGKLHARVIQSIGGACVTAALDTNREAAEALAKEYGCRAYTDADELFADPDVDAVAICLPSGLHAELAVKAARAGKHVICEKPMDTELDRAQQMIDACRENGVRLSVIMQHRFDEPMCLLRKAIGDGLMGKLLWGASRTIWYRDDKYYANPWRGTWKYDGGGALMNQSIHYIDLLLSVMGAPRSVNAKCRTIGHPQIETEDIGLADIEFESGALGTIEGTTCSYPGLYSELAVFGEKGTVIIRNDYLTFYCFKDGPRPEFEAALNQEMANRLNQTPEIEDTSHRRQYEDFVDALREGRDPLVTGEEAIRSLRLIRAAYRSSEEKKEIYF